MGIRDAGELCGVIAGRSVQRGVRAVQESAELIHHCDGRGLRGRVEDRHRLAVHRRRLVRHCQLTVCYCQLIVCDCQRIVVVARLRGGPRASRDRGGQAGRVLWLNSAPDRAGKDLVNPIAAILSTSMMLTWLGNRAQCNNTTHAGQAIESAIADALANNDAKTDDLGGTAKTSEATSAILGHLEKRLAR